MSSTHYSVGPNDSSSLDAPEHQGPGKTTWHDIAIETGMVERPINKDDHSEDNMKYKLLAEVEEERKRRRKEGGDDNDEDEDDEEEDDDDDEFLRSFRSSRIEEMKSKSKLLSSPLPSTPLPPTNILLIDSADFDDKIIRGSNSLPTLLILYVDFPPNDNNSSSSPPPPFFAELSADCHKFISLISTLSIRHPTAFIAYKMNTLISQVVNVDMSDCPSLLIYSKGKKVQQFRHLSDFGGPLTTVEMMEWDMKKCGVLEWKEDGEQYDEEKNPYRKLERESDKEREKREKRMKIKINPKGAKNRRDDNSESEEDN